MAPPIDARLFTVQIIESREKDKVEAVLKITNRMHQPLGRNWRLYFSMGLALSPGEDRLKRVLLDGRYGYFEPAESWVDLAASESMSLPLENWLFTSMPLRAKQGFHLTTWGRSGNEEVLLGSPDIIAPQLAPITRLDNTWINKVSPSCDREVHTALHLYDIHAKTSFNDDPDTVIPCVKKAERLGRVTLSDGLFITEATAALTNEQNHLNEFLQAQALQDTAGLPITLSLDSAAYGPDHYVLHTSAEGVQIRGGNARAVFYGIQTLRQLISVNDRSVELLLMNIEDYPDFEHRAFFLDIARHFQDSAQIRKTIRIMATYKMNRLQLGISNDEAWRLEIPDIPELTSIGAWRAYKSDGDRSAGDKSEMETKNTVSSLG